MPRSRRVNEARAALVQRLRSGAHAPGDRFLSNRAVAERFGVSYQTAHRLLDELAAEGLLERRGQSGTFVPGAAQLRGIELLFHPRAQQSGSFGHKLLSQLLDRIASDGIDAVVTCADTGDPAAERLPVLWECPHTLARLLAADRPAVLLNDRPPLGLGSLHVDSLSPDDFGGGVLAAQLLQPHLKTSSRPQTSLQRRAARARRRKSGRAAASLARAAILAGPEDDVRSRLRVDGFHSIHPAAVVHAGGWYFEHGHAAARELLRRRPAALFCCNDRLAQAAIIRFREADEDIPLVVGFDDAPVAEELGLTTIAIPWEALVDAAARAIARRLAGTAATSSHQILNPRPVIRRTASAPEPAA